MKKLFAVALFAAACAGIGSAGALPLAPLNAGESADVIPVAQGCGPGYARGPMGRCRPMGYGRPAIVVRPPVLVRPSVVVRPGRVCPPGFAFRGGRCRAF